VPEARLEGELDSEEASVALVLTLAGADGVVVCEELTVALAGTLSVARRLGVRGAVAGALSEALWLGVEVAEGVGHSLG
jgi:hypothetical protein